MGIFTEDMVCDICGKKESVGFNPSKSQLKDGWICMSCKEELYGYTYEQMNQLTVEEASKIIDEEKRLSMKEQFCKYHVRYLGGYPEHDQIDFPFLYFFLYDDFLRIRTIAFGRDFKTIKIFYKDIVSVEMVDSSALSIRLSRIQKNKILQVTYYYEGKPMKLMLELTISSTSKEREAYSKIMNYFTAGDGSKKLMNVRKDSAVSIPDEILKYKNLLDMGAITQEEYEKFKKSLLDTL